jgi:hypothetical protein
MKIKPITKYQVGSSEFRTKEEAEAFIKEEAAQKDFFSRNCEILNKSALKYVPCVSASGDLRLFVKRYNNYDQGEGWEDIIHGDHLKYVSGELEVIISAEFIEQFIDLAPSLIVEVNNWPEILSAIYWHLDKADYELESYLNIVKKLLDALAKIQYKSVYL